MRPDHTARGGAAVSILANLDRWEADIVLNLRLWCEGPRGQAQVWHSYRRALPDQTAQHETQAFEALLRAVTTHAHRPLVRHDVCCTCVGSDECVFVNLVKTAADGHLNDAALIATLLVGPAYAEQVALLAGQVGDCARRIHLNTPSFSPGDAPNVVRLH